MVIFEAWSVIRDFQGKNFKKSVIEMSAHTRKKTDHQLAIRSMRRAFIFSISRSDRTCSLSGYMAFSEPSLKSG